MPDDQTPSNLPANQNDPAQPPLPQDNQTPFQPATDDDLVLGDAHQATDSQSDIDSHQLYDEGLAGAAEASEPQDPGVGSFTPPATNDEGEQDADQPTDQTMAS